MRYVAALALILSLSAVPADAGTLGRNFGNAICNQRLICPNDVTTGSFPAYVEAGVTAANQCVYRYFRTQMEDGYFEQSYPDGDGCFEKRPVPPNPNGGPTLNPHCCIVPDPEHEGFCQMSCSIHETR